MWYDDVSKAESRQCTPLDNQLIYLLSILHLVELAENDESCDSATKN